MADIPSSAVKVCQREYLMIMVYLPGVPVWTCQALSNMSVKYLFKIAIDSMSLYNLTIVFISSACLWTLWIPETKMVIMMSGFILIVNVSMLKNYTMVVRCNKKTFISAICKRIA